MGPGASDLSGGQDLHERATAASPSALPPTDIDATVPWGVALETRLSETIPHDGAGSLGMRSAGQVAPTVRVPGFEILEEIGRGGMGVVYKARQINLDRIVALKVLPPAFAADPQRLQRFYKEAETAARVSDKRVLPIHDIIEADGTLVLVMPYIDGPDLAQVIAAQKAHPKPGAGPYASDLGGRSYLDEVLPLLDQAIEAVAAIHAHDPPIIHRDIKPSNLLVDARGNVYLTDFGLARLGLDSHMTQPGSGLGTPGYMSPEQWRAAERAGPPADVFGLGATLYHALTLDLPYGRERIDHLAALPKPPSQRGGPRSKDFDAVVLMALEPDVRHRYATAGELLEDWRCVREQRIPRARRIGPVGRLVRWLRRNAAAVLAIATIVLLCGSLAVALWPTPPPPGPDDPREILLQTQPAGARFVLVPVDPQTGEPRPERATHGRSRTPARLTLAPGDYLVEVQWQDGMFHEVQRRVPMLDEQSHTLFNHAKWDHRTKPLELSAIYHPPAEVLRGMVRIGGGTFRVQAKGEQPRTRTVAPFLVDRTEVTVAAYRAKWPELPPLLRTLQPAEDEPVRFVEYDRAVHHAEIVGKRLPDGAEYDFVATNGGQTRFPWGDDPSLLRPGWPIGPVGGASFDRMLSQPLVRGLYSNVAEWTNSWPSDGLSEHFIAIDTRHDLSHAPPSPPPGVSQQRLVRGAPLSVAERLADPGPAIHEPMARYALPRDVPYPGIGIRCVRSAQPRFLKP